MNKLFTIFLIFCLLPLAQALTVTEFNGGAASVSLLFPTGGESNEFFISLPVENIVSARMTITGLDVEGETVLPADVILVTDTSGSMDDDCPGGGR